MESGITLVSEDLVQKVVGESRRPIQFVDRDLVLDHGRDLDLAKDDGLILSLALDLFRQLFVENLRNFLDLGIFQALLVRFFLCCSYVLTG